MSGRPDEPSPLRTSPLDAAHRALGARMVEFGGWDMPIQYTSVLDEHRACRADAAVFDVSHLGSVRVRGAGARDLLQWALTNDLGRIAPGRAQYTHLLDPADAHVVDDIIVWWLAPDDFVVMPNASNTDRIVAALAGDEPTGPAVVIGDITAERAILAVQGPRARERLATVVPAAAGVARFAVAAVEYDGAPGYAAGTGYTGEDGVELHVPVDVAPAVWAALVGAGITPAGLGCRDTLRLEAGLPLHGHDLGPGITSAQAGLGWVVRLDKGDFRGRAAVVAEHERGVARHLVGIITEGRQVARADCAVLVDGAPVGGVTSGNFSPMLERGIALAFVPPAVGVGAAVTIDVRGRPVAGEVVALPFWPR
ncbi:MAG: glycine cleavage system aminomethyltransferase GcvT [Actinomycetota bacterium]